jgi:hypothetical protein
MILFRVEAVERKLTFGCAWEFLELISRERSFLVTAPDRHPENLLICLYDFFLSHRFSRADYDFHIKTKEFSLMHTPITCKTSEIVI